jgi:hypothetical protein
MNLKCLLGIILIQIFTGFCPPNKKAGQKLVSSSKDGILLPQNFQLLFLRMYDGGFYCPI